MFECAVGLFHWQLKTFIATLCIFASNGAYPFFIWVFLRVVFEFCGKTLFCNKKVETTGGLWISLLDSKLIMESN